MNKKGKHSLALFVIVAFIAIVLLVVICIKFPAFKQNFLELIGAVRGTESQVTQNLTQNIT